MGGGRGGGGAGIRTRQVRGNLERTGSSNRSRGEGFLERFCRRRCAWPASPEPHNCSQFAEIPQYIFCGYLLWGARSGISPHPLCSLHGGGLGALVGHVTRFATSDVLYGMPCQLSGWRPPARPPGGSFLAHPGTLWTRSLCTHPFGPAHCPVSLLQAARSSPYLCASSSAMAHPPDPPNPLRPAAARATSRQHHPSTPPFNSNPA